MTISVPYPDGPEGSCLKVRDLCKSFRTAAGDKDVLRGIDLNVDAGEWVSVLGRSGSGKSTLLRCASGLVSADSGSSEITGVNVASASADVLARLRRSSLGFVFQDYNLIESLTARENVALPLLLGRDTTDVDDRVARALADTGMMAQADQPASTLSGGEQQRVSIARALAQRPSVLFADEPTGALDSVTTRVVLDLFRRLTDQGSGVLMVTHDLDAAARGDRALVLVDGRVEHDLTRPTADDLFEIMSTGEER